MKKTRRQLPRGLAAQVRSEWKITGLVLLLGACVGWVTAAANARKVDEAPVVIRPEIVSLPHTFTLAVVPVPGAISNEQRQARELERLKTRNRRLEALVRDLREQEFAALEP